MDIKDLVEEAGYQPKRKAACRDGLYCSPCPFCKDGNTRFSIRPSNPDYQGGSFFCWVCQRGGDAISFLRSLYGLSYKEACGRLRIEPQAWNNSPVPRPPPKPLIAEEPSDLWKDKAGAFVAWAHKQLLNSHAGLTELYGRGFTDDSISRFNLGYSPETMFRERHEWGLEQQLKEDGKPKKLCLSAGLVIPSFSGGQVVKVKIRRSEWKEGDKWSKYVEVSGSKQSLSIYGDPTLSCSVVLESELDAMLIQQHAADLVYCVALGGSTKPLDADTDQLLRKTPLVLFLPDFDEAGAVAWSRWQKKFPHIQRILTPHEKSAGDYLLKGGNLREWIKELINEAQRKREKNEC